MKRKEIKKVKPVSRKGTSRKYINVKKSKKISTIIHVLLAFFILCLVVLLIESFKHKRFIQFIYPQMKTVVVSRKEIIGIPNTEDKYISTSNSIEK